ncbi:7351_t:CDS:10 [Entrophospora sp. SA101]|nr:23724_t:CDS:10 [Entrophospora sp. SA101]CAJ0753666.1 7351_t:CDS:10 [Entrophospora sp. SA101]CAJ0862176.1 14115_t:CDS:10 [Entrophospora sp. SA101]
MTTHRRHSFSSSLSYETDEIDEFNEFNDYSGLIEEKIMNEEYKIWKKNSSYLYDLLIADTLESTLFTCQWFKDFYRGEDYRMQRILMGVHLKNDQQNYIQIGAVELPLNGATIMSKRSEEGINGSYDYNYGIFKNEWIENDDGDVPNCKRLSIVQMIKHEGAINRARYNPKDQNIIATKSEYKNVYIFDRAKHPDKPANTSSSCRPELTLNGHTEQGHGLSWNSFKNGHIIDSSKDMTICYWDISGNSDGNMMEPLRIFKGPKSCIQDVEWHAFNPNMFGSVDHDRNLLIWDSRCSCPVGSVQAHEKELTTLAFNPINEVVLVTGSADKNLNLWDIRNLKIKLYTLKNHESNIVDVKWSPHDENILASASADKKVNLWNINKIGAEQTSEKVEDGPPELLFMHGGHIDKISELSWNPLVPLMIAMLEEDSSDEFYG